MNIRVDDLTGAAIIALLEQHVRDMHAVSPPGSCHVLDLANLRKPDITFWSIWDGASLAGCGAIKEISPQHAEIKSMRTADGHHRKGVGSKILRHILDEAQRRGYRRVSLETGAQPYFDPARRLYASFGFRECAAFEGYAEDPASIFMTRELG